MDDGDPANLMLNMLFVESGFPTWASVLLKVALLFLLIFINAFFAMSEIAILSLNETKISKLAEEGNKKAKNVLKLTENTSNFLSAIQIGVTLAGFFTSAVAADSFATMITDAIMLKAPSLPRGIISTVSLVVLTIITSYFSLVFGELVPKKIALKKSEKVSFAIAGFLRGFMKITKPVVSLLSHSTNGVCKLIGIDPTDTDDDFSEEDILMMIESGEEKGAIENSQSEMISNIFEFDDIDASDIMTHRVDMTAVEDTDSVEDVIEIAIDSGFSRIPVYHEDPDDIIGMVYVKDLLKYVGKQMPKDKTIRSIMREAYFVPKNKKCDDLFKEMSEKHIQIAVVVDEYGGTAGVVTIEDLMESVFGSIQDEFDEEEDEIAVINDNTYTVDGNTDIEEIDDILGFELPEGEYETIAGFILDNLGYLPENGKNDVVEFENVKFTVLSVDERRIEKVKIEILPKPEEPTEEEK